MDATGFETHISDGADIHPPAQKVRQELSRRDCLCAIATREAKLEDDNRWRTSSWIISEIGMAYSLKKTIICFVEKGVEAKGLLGEGFTYFEFDRETLHQEETMFRLVRDIVKQRDKIVDELSTEAKPEENFRIERMCVRLILEPSGYWYIEREFEIVSQQPQLADIIDGTWISNSSELPFINPEFSVSSPDYNYDKGRHVKGEIIAQNRENIHWRITISPPLEEDEHLTYCWDLRTKGYISLFLDEITEQIKKNVYYYNEPSAEEGVTITAPTKRLEFEVRFPLGYRIKDCDFAITKGYDTSARKLKKEYKRLIDSGCFLTNISGRRHLLQLKVDNPLPLHTYMLIWRPPTRAEAESIFSVVEK